MKTVALIRLHSQIHLPLRTYLGLHLALCSLLSDLFAFSYLTFSCLLPTAFRIPAVFRLLTPEFCLPSSLRSLLEIQ